MSRPAALSEPVAPWEAAPVVETRAAVEVMHIFPGFDVGGVQVRFAALVAALGPRYRHSVVSLSGSLGAADLLPQTAPVRYCAKFPQSGGLLERLGRHRARLVNEQPDVLVTYNWGAMEIALANLALGLPHLHMEDGFGPEESAGQLPRRIWTRRLALARSEVIVPSKTLQAIATTSWSLPERRVHYIPNGLVPQDAPKGDGVSAPAFSAAGRPVIVWTGALRPEKNPLRLIRAFAPLKDQARLVLIGEGPERGAIVAEAERLSLGESLQLLGHRLDARDIIARADILALSSDTEQMPFAVLEAMDAGLPVVSTHVGDVREMLSAENARFVVPLSELELACALKTLVENPALRTRIGRANRARVRKVYPFERMVSAHRGLLETLAARRRPDSAKR